jgi:hypothetical protein
MARRAASWLQGSLTLDISGLRGPGGLMLALAFVLPLFPHDPGLPCPLRTVTGVPCPFCGMTTSVKATCHGHLLAAVSANPFGPVAVLVAVALLLFPHRSRVARIPWGVAVAAPLVAWGWELRRFGFL